MATIKSLLSSTLESFLTSKKVWIGQQGFPVKPSITLNLTKTSEGYYLYTSPIDAVFCIQAFNVGSLYFHQPYLGSGIAGGALAFRSYFGFVRKGETIGFTVGDSATDLLIRLAPIVAEL